MYSDPHLSGEEYWLEPGLTLLSTTDLSGRITFCNEAFELASGYSREELLGQPHNIIRHPDMPRMAFADLWSTIRSGTPWSMLVKNQRKDGGYYWVLASVTPLMADGAVLGYMSVRTVPTRSEIEQAAALYADLKAVEIRGTSTPYTLVRGQLRRTGLVGRIDAAMAALRALPGAAPILGATLVASTVACHAGILAGGIAALPLAIGASRLHRQVLERSGHGLLDFARHLAGGDLSNRRFGVTHGGGFGKRLHRSLEQLSVNLRAMVGDARSRATSMGTILASINAGKNSLSQSTDAQAAGLEQSAAALRQLTETVDQNVQAAERGAVLAEKTLQVALRSTASVESMRATMSDISQATARISDISQVIDAISFQTNILALNAAVEAARAGEQGKGFAVVAQEVRALAARTTAAAREIKILSQGSLQQVSAGVSEVGGAAAAITETASAATQLSELVSNVHRASREQLQAISEISAAVNSLDDMTQRNASLVEDLSASADLLSSEASTLTASVSIFRF